MEASGLSFEGLEDVEDFTRVDEGESSMSFERLCHVSDHIQKGNRAFRNKDFEEAILCYSTAHAIKPGDPIILSNRCNAYLRLCQFLKGRPPLASEYRPLRGLDPTTHAEFALMDAEKVMSLRSNSIKSYIMKANALILLEKYELARDVINSGLQLDPLSNPLKVLEKETDNVSRKILTKPERTDDFDCTLCLKLLYEPVTTPCGHSFCRSCLFQSMDRGNRCPLCRTILFICPKTCSTSVTLNNIIQKIFPEEYTERKLEHESTIYHGADFMPLFVMDVVLPCQKFQLNIFEPRYRLLVRRIMEGNRRMGMAILDASTGSIADFACEVEVTECEPLPDGRFFLELESRRRFLIIRNWDQDGYRVAEVQWVQDLYPAEGTKEQIDLQEMTNNAAAFARSWMRTAREAAQQHLDRRRLLELDKFESLMPTTRDPERFSFWLATLTNRRPSERLQLLQMRDTLERMRRSLVFLRAGGD
ncbi:LON peptidase N-terminal domain and RING finger protein 1 isoform X2 [Impatiens glandulifera]|uniref:LON peptidase N-terminal domain and RING finger protein 1 isoform X2 n=1 Tax=Impatiens glandulifera TaxID=253017 RepID=UPI001FB06263|nr:LON peptidase N-terminal domain and RING finger protein 1 isoform X2 [Impatiens glandulifera]